MNSFSRGVRNAFRNGIRTVSIVLILALAIGLALAMLVARQAVDKKISDVKANVGNNIIISPQGMRGFGGGGFGGTRSTASGGANSGATAAPSQGNTLTTDDYQKVKAIAHITSVDATLTARATSGADTNLVSPVTVQPRNNSSANSTAATTANGATFQMPIAVTGTTDPDAALASLGDNTVISSGATIDGNSTDNVALVGSDLAAKNNLAVGSTFTLYGATVTVQGVVTTAAAAAASTDSAANSAPRGRNLSLGSAVIMPLPALQNLSANSGTINSMTATVDNVSNTDAAVAAITAALGTDADGNNVADVTSDVSAAQPTLDALNSIKTTGTISVVACGAAAAVIIFLAMLMIVRERRGEIGVLKAIGARGKTIVVQFVAESLVLTVLAAAIGLGVGILAATPLTNTLVSSAQSAASANNSANSNNSNSGNSGSGNSSNSNSGNSANSGGANTARRGNNFANFVGAGARNIGTVTAQIDWTIVVYAFAGAVVIAAIGAAAASLIAMRVRPAEAVRAE